MPLALAHCRKFLRFTDSVYRLVGALALSDICDTSDAWFFASILAALSRTHPVVDTRRGLEKTLHRVEADEEDHDGEWAEFIRQEAVDSVDRRLNDGVDDGANGALEVLRQPR